MSICEGVEKMKKMKGGKSAHRRERMKKKKMSEAYIVKKWLRRVWLMELRVILVI